MTSPDSTKERGAAAAEEAKCPVDHKTRETWLQQARSEGGAPSPAGPRGDTRAAAPAQAPAAPPPTRPTASSSSSSWWSSWAPWSWRRTPSSCSSEPQRPPGPGAAHDAPRPHGHLGTSRVTSSIPRSSPSPPSTTPARPSNHEQETGASASGHWVYPSESMFFAAMRRKGFDAAAAGDMRAVVPIHNAVNERAWAEIVEWERPYAAPCGGPRLHSFAGRGRDHMTPRARLNALLGYTAPFDRHDWVVDRCGTRVEYVIDFYAGRPDAQGAGKLSFYLDVRPKLNTWEGVKMRVLRATGLA